jgi:hypothetical protein
MLKSNRSESERQRITACVAALCEAFNRKPTPATFVAYDLGLEGIPVEAVESACCAAFRNPGAYMPTPGELRELCGETKSADRAILAFAALERAVSEVGYYKSPDFDDPLINATVRMLGGWERVCEMGAEEFDKWYRKEFEKTYTALMRTGVDGEATAPLVGCFEKTNRVLGYTQGEVKALVGHDNTTKVATGLPWAGQQPKRLGSAGGPGAIPRIEFKRP